jgi:hypothetical protein
VRMGQGGDRFLDLLGAGAVAAGQLLQDGRYGVDVGSDLPDGHIRDLIEDGKACAPGWGGSLPSCRHGRYQSSPLAEQFAGGAVVRLDHIGDQSHGRGPCRPRRLSMRRDSSSGAEVWSLASCAT